MDRHSPVAATLRESVHSLLHSQSPFPRPLIPDCDGATLTWSYRRQSSSASVAFASLFSEAPSSRINTTYSFPPSVVLPVCRVSRTHLDRWNERPTLLHTIFLIQTSPHLGSAYSLDGKNLVLRVFGWHSSDMSPIRFWYMVHLASWKGWSLILVHFTSPCFFYQFLFFSISLFFLPSGRQALDGGYC